MDDSLITRITDLQTAYNRAHGKEPTVVRLKPDDEMALFSLGDHFSAEKMREMHENGVRSAVTKLLGMLVEWDADVTSVA